MGFGGISIWQLLIVLLIVVMLFGTKRLRSLGSDLGSAIKGFKKSISDEDEAKNDTRNVEDKTAQDNITSAQKEKTEQK